MGALTVRGYRSACRCGELVTAPFRYRPGHHECRSEAPRV